MLADALNSSPFAVLTFIAAPAILTNASSVLTLSTGNRFARAIDRARALASAIAAQRPDAPGAASPPSGHAWLPDDLPLLVRQLDRAERRVLLLVRALTAFYFAVGSFALGTLTSLAGASLSALGYTDSTHAVLLVAIAAGVCGVGGLVTGATLLVWESRLTHRILHEEAMAISQFARDRQKAWEAARTGRGE